MIKRDLRWIFLLTILIPLAAWDRFIVPAGTEISDIMISHFPNLLFIQRSLVAGQGVPLWSPMILSGYPFSANPLSSLWYPPAWLSLIFPLPLGINLVMALHVLIGVSGFYFFLGQQDLDPRIRLPGSILFGLLPAGYTHIVSGHFTWVCASAWLPWLLYTSTSFGLGKWKKAGLSAFFLGLMLLADMRFSAYAGVLWLAFDIFRNTRAKLTFQSWLFQFASGTFLAAGIGAAVWMPLLEYAGMGTRSAMTVSDTLYLSLPAIQLTGLVVPGHPSSMEWIFYPGAMILLLLLISFSMVRKRPDIGFWLIFGLIFFLWALGDAIPINQLVAELPGISLLRVPSRGLYFFNIALLNAALIVLDELLKNNPTRAVYLRLVTIFFALMGILFQIVIVLVEPDKNSFILWHTGCWLVVTVLIIAYSYRRLNAAIFVILLGVIAVTDLMLVDIRLAGYLPKSDALQSGKPAAEYVKTQGDGFRVFSPSYSIPQQTAATNSIELADGIDPLQLNAYSSFIRNATGFTENGYSVTLPPFKSGDPTVDNIGIQPDAELFGLLNVKYLVSAFPIVSDVWIFRDKVDDTFVYENPLSMGWAWVENSGFGGKTPKQVLNITRTANRIALAAEGPGRLVLSEINYPGWKAQVDGQSAEISTAYDVLRSVELSEGRHTIEFIYIPVLLFASLAVSLISLIASGALIWKWNSHGN